MIQKLRCWLGWHEYNAKDVLRGDKKWYVFSYCNHCNHFKSERVYDEQ